MHEITPTGEFAVLLKLFQDAGGVVEYVLIEREKGEEAPNMYERHKAAAIFAIHRINARNPYYAHPGNARVEPEKAHGTRIRLSEFFAPIYLKITAETLESNPYLSQEGISNLSPRVKDGQSILYNTGSYRSVFCEPPYGLAPQGKHLPNEEARTLFRDINIALFGKDKSHLIVYSWSTDWANYFDPGNIWWGSHLWTVENPHSSLMIGIAASASD